jgi:hypothetical protein
MKFSITMKDPDGFYDSLQEAIEADVAEIEDEEEREHLRSFRQRKLSALLSTWFRYGEYLTVEIDTVAETCRVVPTSA